MVYHLLDESEPFSEKTGGAIQRIVANLLRVDDNSRVVCGVADDSWGFPEERVVKLSPLRGRTRWRGMVHYPKLVQKALLREWFAPLERELKEGDVIWVHSRPDIITQLAPTALKMKSKLVLHMHNSFSPYRPNSSFFPIFAATEKVVFVSKFLEQEARDRFVMLGHTKAMHNGTDGSLFHPAASKPNREVPVVTFVGRITPVKGVHILVDAMRLLEAKGVKLKARIIGSSFFGGAVGKYMSDLRDKAPSNVVFEGYSTGSTLADAYRDSDFFCCPSIWQDPFPTVNLEAMGCGLACVASSVGGIPEQFAEGGALMVPPNDARALADALEKLATDPMLRAELGAQGFENFQRNFRWEIAGQRYESILRSL